MNWTMMKKPSLGDTQQQAGGPPIEEFTGSRRPHRGEMAGRTRIIPSSDFPGEN